MWLAVGDDKVAAAIGIRSLYRDIQRKDECFVQLSGLLNQQRKKSCQAAEKKSKNFVHTVQDQLRRRQPRLHVHSPERTS